MRDEAEVCLKRDLKSGCGVTCDRASSVHSGAAREGDGHAALTTDGGLAEQTELGIRCGEDFLQATEDDL